MSVKPITIKDVDEKEQEFHIDCQTDQEGTISNPREKLLIILAFIFLVLVLSLLSAIIISIAVGNLFPQSMVCMTKHCVKRAAYILENLDENVKPCDDFYEYSCGGWKNKNMLKMSERGVLGDMQLKIYRDMLKVIKDLEKDEKISEKIIAKKIVNATTNCIDFYSSTNKSTFKDSYNQIFDEFGGFPLVKQPTENIKREVKIAKLFSLYGADPVIGISVAPNDKNTKENILVISPPDASFFDKDINDITPLIINFIQETFSETKEESDLSKFKEIYVGVKNILKEKLDYSEMLISRNNMTALTKIIEINVFDMPSFISELVDIKTTLNPPQANPPNKPIAKLIRNKRQIDNQNSKLKILITYPDTIAKILKLFKQNDEKDLSNYLSIQFMRKYRQLNLPDIARASDDIKDEIAMACLLDVSTYLNFAFDSIYINNSSIPLAEPEDVILHIKYALRSFLGDYKWLDNHTKLNIQNKLDSMKYYIGYPPWILDKNKIENYYAELEFNSSESALTNYVKMIKFSKKQILKTLTEENDRNSWPKFPEFSMSTVNAFYAAHLNIFVLPAAILNPPMLDINVPLYLTFGSLGTVIGHEITHGFDTNGRVRNSFGNLPDHEMWTATAIRNYKNRTECFIKQYSNYKIGNMTIDGNSTLAENIADNGAIHEAFWAYKDWLKENREGKVEESLPALTDFTHEQLFFISFAQSWCHIASRKSLQMQIKTDEHTPNKYRVIGALANSKEFAEAFNCVNNNIMNQKEKCNIW